MATYIGGVTGFSTTSENVTLTTPGGAASGDVFIVDGTYPAGGGPQYVAPVDTTGWTQLTDAASQSPSPLGEAKHSVWIKKFTSSPPASIEFTAIGGSSPRNMGVQMHVWRGMDNTQRALSDFTTDGSGTISSIDHPTVTMPSPGGTVLLIGHWDSTTIASLASTGYTVRANFDPTGTFTHTMYMLSKEGAAAGATGAIPVTFTANNAFKVVYTLAVADESTGPVLPAEAGSYSKTGQPQNLLVGRNLVADQGTYSVTGQTSNLLKASVLVAAQGAYLVFGQDASLEEEGGYVLVAESGTYTVTGSIALRDFELDAETGIYDLSGQIAGLNLSQPNIFVLPAEHGTYSLTGQDAASVRERVLAAVAGQYSLTGNSAGLSKPFATAAEGLVRTLRFKRVVIRLLGR